MALVLRKNEYNQNGQERQLNRLPFFKIGLFLWTALLLARLFSLQVLDHNYYSSLATGQREIFSKLAPERGDILLQDKSGRLYPLATNQDKFLVFADTREIKDKEKTAKVLTEILGADEAAIKERINKPDDPFEPIEHGLTEDKMTEIQKANLPGIYFSKESFRFYPLDNISSQVSGFVGEDEQGNKQGRYGVEGAYDEDLRGKEGVFKGEGDVSGQIISLGTQEIKEAQDGLDIILTIDRNIQYTACQKLDEAVAKHGASGGSVVIMDPKTGRILAMCGAPDFDPNNYGKVKDANVFNNPVIFNQYEPGSVFKIFTMAAGLDTGEVAPETTYEDTGKVQFGAHTIMNSDNKAYGTQTMTEVLEKSLNTGAVFVARKVGLSRFRDYVKKFDFGAPVKIGLEGEAKGDTRALEQKGEIYLATASFGQGISVTPLQLLKAVGAIANDGKLVQPYLVEKKQNKDGKVLYEATSQILGQAILPKTTALLSGMMTQVVENGHGKRAGVKGYFIAGKTGTAQIPRQNGPGYEEGVSIGTFAGFGPVEDPRFVMVTRIDKPRDVQFAESSAAPLFGEIADFLLKYMEVKPTRS